MTIHLTEYTRLLGVYLTPLWGRIGILAVILFGSAGLNLLNPQIMRYYLGTAQSGGALQSLMFAAVVFIGITFVGQTLSVWMVYLGTDVGWRATNALRTRTEQPAGKIGHILARR